MNTAEAGIYAREFDFLDRYVQFGAAGEKIIQLSFPQQPDGDADSEHELLDRIQAYLDNEDEDFRDVDVGLTVPTDHRSVLEAVREIPYGDQASVEQLARMAPGLDPDDEDDAQAVRSALRANPVPIFVPDHRVEDAPGATPSDVAATLRNVEQS
jgi:methylated-DNA-[protein]-cysteine S-methyltransferase